MECGTRYRTLLYNNEIDPFKRKKKTTLINVSIATLLYIRKLIIRQQHINIFLFLYIV